MLHPGYSLKHTLITALGFMLGLNSPVWAATTNIYRWVDANGQVHYADHPNHAKARPVNLPVDRPINAVAGQTPAPATAASLSAASKLPPQVNINSADAATLAQSLEGIGEQKANAIVAHRKKHGPFKSVDALDQVKGIGEKTLEKTGGELLLDNRPYTRITHQYQALSLQGQIGDYIPDLVSPSGIQFKYAGQPHYFKRITGCTTAT